MSNAAEMVLSNTALFRVLEANEIVGQLDASEPFVRGMSESLMDVATKLNDHMSEFLKCRAEDDGGDS